jgi:hypothetical protein
MLTVKVDGTTTTAHCLALAALGDFASSFARLWITIEEWPVLARPTQPKRIINSYNNIGSPTSIFQRDVMVGYILETDDNKPASCTFSVAINHFREYHCLIHLEQYAGCHGPQGYALAASTVVYEFGPIFYEFT